MTDNITLPRAAEQARNALDRLLYCEQSCNCFGRAALAARKKEQSEDIEALRRDAERYRWLQDAGQKYWMEFADMTAEATEAAIDAAMKGGSSSTRRRSDETDCRD